MVPDEAGTIQSGLRRSARACRERSASLLEEGLPVNIQTAGTIAFRPVVKWWRCSPWPDTVTL